MSQIELENVSFTYGGDTSYEKKALDGVSVTFRSGIITGLIGHTGSGKSTLVQLLNGFSSLRAAESCSTEKIYGRTRRK